MSGTKETMFFVGLFGIVGLMTVGASVLMYVTAPATTSEYATKMSMGPSADKKK